MADVSDALLVIDDEQADVFIITGLVKRLLQEGHRVHCLASESVDSILRFNENCSVEDIENGTLCKYDIAINFSPTDKATRIIDRVSAKNKFGYGKERNVVSFYNEGADHHYRAKHIGIPTDANLFQLIYGLAGKTWQGEGYSLQYYPRNRARKNLAGVAIRSANIRNYICKNLQVDRTRLWHIPFKQNLLKQIDETNRCPNVITDDMVVLNVALALRKHVEFIAHRPLPFKLEMFGSGNTHMFNNKKLGLVDVRN